MKYIIILFVIGISFSCKKQNLAAGIIDAFKKADSALMVATKKISIENEGIYYSFKEKLREPMFMTKAMIYNPQIDKVRAMADSLYSYLEDIKLQLKKTAGLRTVLVADKKEGANQVDTFDEVNINASNNFFEAENNGNEIQLKVNRFEENILSIDPRIKVRFNGKLGLNEKLNYHDLPVMGSLMQLSRIEYYIRNTENRVAVFFYSQASYDDPIIEFFQPIAVASSTYLKQGDKLTITAGIGEFNNKSNPIISFNGKEIPLNYNAVAEKKYTVSKIGRHSVHVKIIYNDPYTGKKQSLEKNVEYEVAP
jgi:hypothetical protein